MNQLQEALAVFCAWEARDPREAPAELLAQHEHLRDLLEPMLVDPEADDVPVEGDLGRDVGPYRLIRELGRGGMGVVYEAAEQGLGRTVALKVLSAHLTLSPTAVARFQREANLTANLDHPGIVNVFGVGQDEGHYWFAMEQLKGMPLDRLLRELDARQDDDGAALQSIAQRTESPSTDASSAADRLVFVDRRPRAMARIGLQLADALAFAHAHGVLHRDVKPANAILLPTGRVVLTDFGLARQGDAPGMTQTGMFAGTPHYASPEQTSGAWDEVGPPSDVFSLGATMYELLSGRRAFDGDEVAFAIRNHDPVDLTRVRADVPADLAAIVHKALEKNPLRRYASAAEFAADIRAWLEYRPVSARRTTAFTRIGRWARREPFRAALVALLVIAIPGFAGLGGYVYASSDLVSAGQAALAERELDAALDRGFGELATSRLGHAMRIFERVAMDHTEHPEALAGQLLVLGQLQTSEPLAVWLEENRTAVDAHPALGELADTMRRGLDPHNKWVDSREGWQTSDYAIAGYYCLVRARSSTEQEWVDRAVLLFQQAALAADRLHYHCAWARAAAEAGDERSTAAAVEGLRRLFPDRVPALLAIADITRGDDADAAQAAFVTAARLAPSDPDVMAHAANFAGADAPERFDAVLAAHPQHLPALIGRARIYRAAGDTERATELLLTAASTDAFDVEAWLDGRRASHAELEFSPYSQQTGQTDYIVELALALTDLGRHDEARDILTRSRGISPQIGSARAAIASMLLQTNRIEQAREQLRPDLTAGSEHPRVWTIAARIETAARDDDTALKYAKHACELAPDNAAARLGLATVHFNRRELEPCEAETLAAIRLAPLSERASRMLRDVAVWKNEPAYLLREAERFAEALFEAGRPAAAAEALKEYRVMPPEEVLPGSAEHSQRIEASIRRYEEANR